MYEYIRVRRVPSYELGEWVLGRAWPYQNLIEIDYNLAGEEFEEVLEHELTHIKYRLSEYLTRVITRIKLLAKGKIPKFH
jgi:hypothetical protein